MRVSTCAGLLATGASLASAFTIKDFQAEHQLIAKRGIINTQQLNASYDFIIAGGGLAGLVLASRLTEDANKTVLVIEAGQSGYAIQHQIDVPGNAYYSSLLGTDADWQYKTVEQTHAGNRVMDWPRGKVLGGSTAVNGMYLVRPSKVEIDTWATLAGPNGTENWGWEPMFRAMKKSERFTPPSDDVKTQGSIDYIMDNHGTNGPLDYSYPPSLYPIIGQWTTVLNNIGVAVSEDPNGGDGWGSFVATSAINPSNWTRSYARSAYIDPLPPRNNLHILPDTQVMNVITKKDAGGKVTATGVTYATGRQAEWKTVNANKEVILAGGAIGSPQMLLLSGIGPKGDLASHNINSVIDLPGVGAHLQDHIATSVNFNSNATTPDAAADGAQSFNSFVNSAISYVNVTDLFGDWDATFKEIVGNNLTWAVENALPANTDPTVIEGYKATYMAAVNDLILSKVGHIELLLWLTSKNGDGKPLVVIQAALQHPYSRGKLSLASSSPWDNPIIDPNYLVHPADTLVLREGLKLARKVGNTAPFSDYMISEQQPGSAVTTDAEWDAWLPSQFQTEYHCSCSCSMLPLEQGGVVDANLRVHGTNNLRVIDSSVFPIEFSAHLMAVTYALGERASDLIKFDYMAERPSSTNSTGGQNATSPEQPTGSQKPGSSSTSTPVSGAGAAASTTPSSGALSGMKTGLSSVAMVVIGAVMVTFA